MNSHGSDILVIGAGIAGASAAAELASGARVTLLDMEDQAGYHATGRSAAYFAAAYGHRTVRLVTACCEGFFRNPPQGFADVPLIVPRDNMLFGRGDQALHLESMHREMPELEFLDEAAVRRRVPVFSPGYLHGALWDRRGGDLDVDALLQAYLRMLRRRGGDIRMGHRVVVISRLTDRWRVTASGRTFEAPVLVNAAGAWADTVAVLAGLEPLGVRPFRRTAVTIDAPARMDIRGWPNMIDVDEEFYFKPDAGHLLVSPADETPSDPCDAQPEDLDVALGVDRFERATGLDIRRVHHRWAGLRTFAPDRVFVAGFDPRASGFFWLAGQGGYGIQSAPALAQFARFAVLGVDPDEGFERMREFARLIAPDRFVTAGSPA